MKLKKKQYRMYLVSRLGIMVPKFSKIVIDSIVCSISFLEVRKHIDVPNSCINFSILEQINKKNAEN